MVVKVGPPFVDDGQHEDGHIWNGHLTPTPISWDGYESSGSVGQHGNWWYLVVFTILEIPS